MRRPHVHVRMPHRSSVAGLSVRISNLSGQPDIIIVRKYIVCVRQSKRLAHTHFIYCLSRAQYHEINTKNREDKNRLPSNSPPTTHAANCVDIDVETSSKASILMDDSSSPNEKSQPSAYLRSLPRPVFV